uniref:Uncharacterized protein n=1 Tax=Arundo donax TaxID=35708 RepID=A0A0A8YME6_ARUDO
MARINRLQSYQFSFEIIKLNK